MKIRHQFKVTGDLFLKQPVLFVFRDRVYELSCDDEGYLDGLSITHSIDPDDIPRVSRNPDNGQFEFVIPASKGHEELRDELRTAEGLLSMIGLKELGLTEPKTKWIPESDAEKSSLTIMESSIERGSIRNRVQRPQQPPDDMVVRYLVMATRFSNYQIPLSFLRKGKIDLDQGWYIDAFYDFYFVFENLFANGKFKSSDVKQEFRNSQELIRIGEEMRKDLHERIDFDNPQEKLYCDKYYSKKTIQECMDRIVELRGFLHHHNSKRKDIWHPDNHSAYKIDAIFCYRLAITICYEKTCSVLTDKEAQELLAEVAIRV